MISDVVYAQLWHGILPYGQLRNVQHGRACHRALLSCRLPSLCVRRVLHAVHGNHGACDQLLYIHNGSVDEPKNGINYTLNNNEV